jgi:hypothetical protein
VIDDNIGNTVPFPKKVTPDPTPTVTDEEIATVKALMMAERELLYVCAVETRILAARAGDNECVNEIADLLRDTTIARRKLAG